MTNSSTKGTFTARHYGSLVRKHAFVFGALVAGSLLVSGIVNIYFTYQEHKAALIAMQSEKAEASARRIEQYVIDIEQRIAFTTPPKPGISPFAHRKAEVEALVRVPAIMEVALLDTDGNENFRISRRNQSPIPPDRLWSSLAAKVKPGEAYHSPVYFLPSAKPYMSIAMAVGTKEAGVTVAHIGLEFLHEGISRITADKAGYAYAVDNNGQLIAHPDLNLVRKKTDLSNLPQVKAALTQTSKQRVFPEGRDFQGRPVFAAYGVIPDLGWYVFVEQPQSETYAPLYFAILRAVVSLLAGLLLTVVAAVALVRRTLHPIEALRKGAILIGGGNLDHRIEVHTDDELEELAGQFNRMASRLHTSYASLEEKVRERTRELERANSELAEVSITDPLTGLRNRRFLQKTLDADVALVLRRYEDYLSSEGSTPKPSMDLLFFMVDIDHFKSVNDKYGHPAGDTVLQQLPMRLREVFRESDYLIRWGGEEFMVVARATERSEVDSLGERICTTVAERPFILDDGIALQLTCSVGYACFPFVPTLPHLLPWSQVVEVADRALYLSKHGGRNTWTGIQASEQAASSDLFERVMRELEATLQSGEVCVVGGKVNHESTLA